MTTVPSNEPNEGATKASVPSKIPKEKRTVYIQVNFIRVGEICTVKETFDAEIMIKSRWREPSLDGKKEEEVSLEEHWNPKVYIENAVGDPHTRIVLGTEQNAQHETFLVERKKFRGSFVELMELWDFPFDVQELSILIKSDTSIHDTELVDETQEMHKIHKRSFIDEQEFYLYKYVESSIPSLSIDHELGLIKSKKPSLKVTIHAARLPHYFIWNMFLLMSIIVILSFTSYGIDVRMLPNRLQLTFVLVLAAVTFKSIVTAHIPKISYLTYLDTYVLTMTILLATISCWHGCMTRVVEKYKAEVDRSGLILLGVFFTLFHIGFSLWVLFKPYTKRRDLQRKEKAYQAKYTDALRTKWKSKKAVLATV